MTNTPVCGVTPSLISAALALADKSSGYVGRTRGRALQQEDARVLRLDGSKVVPERVVCDLRQRARELHAGRAPAHDHERQPFAPLLGIVLSFSRLECVQDFATDLGGLLNAFQAGRVAPPIVVAEVGISRAGGDNQRIVFDRRAVIKNYGAALGVQIDGFAQQHLRVLLPPQHGAKRRGDFAWRQRASGHLIEQRLEQVEIAAVQQCNLHGCVLQGLRGVQAAESSAQDHDAMRVVHCRPPSNPLDAIPAPWVHTCDTLKLMLALLPLLLLAVVTAALAQTPCEGTPAYSPCEMPFELSAADLTAHPNPYVSVTLRVEFRSPLFRTYAMPAFWDGGRKMIVRFTPTEAGQWTFKATSNVASFDGREGMFSAVASDASGFVTVANVHHWATDNQQVSIGAKKPHLWMGYIADRFAFESYAEFQQELSGVAQNKFNHFRGSILGGLGDRSLVYLGPDRPNPVVF